MNKGLLYVFALAGTIILLFLANLAWGSVSIPWREVMAILSGNSADSSSETFRYIVLESRLPQAVTALLSGAALATSGLLLQTSFRNPLAGPDVFGISSGAGLAVAVVMLSLAAPFRWAIGVWAFSILPMGLLSAASLPSCWLPLWGRCW